MTALRDARTRSAGVYESATVTVRRRAGLGRLHAVRADGRLTVTHGLTAAEVSDALAQRIPAQLGPLGQHEFEQVLTGLVLSTVDGAENAWETFYRNSIRELEDGTAPFSPIHEHAESLCLGASVLDLGSCFGFFPLRLARANRAVLATDLCAAAMGLLARNSAALGRPVRTLVCDATNVPLPDESADTVTVLHLIEHLDAAASDSVLREAMRLARRRVVVAVPFEDEPARCYGHVRAFGLASLRGVAAGLGGWGPARVYEHHGGWLVLDRAAP